MSITRINISADPSSNMRQTNNNIEGKNVNQSNNSYNMSPKISDKNIFEPTINIGDFSKNSSKDSSLVSELNLYNININLILNLICIGNHKLPKTKSETTKPEHSPLIDKLSTEEKKIALSVDLTAKGKDGKPMYLIGKGRDGKNHLYKNQDGKYKAAGKNVPKGSRKLKPKNITTDKNGVSQAGSGSKTSSPLILDTNKDGKVSAKHGIGIDVNGDDRADGAAVAGDKMLTLDDINKNGKIDGTEVFGDKTIDPFTNKPINAKNGFEALRKVALSAQKATGKKIVDVNGKVDIQKLNQALQDSKKGKLGLISDDNTTTPEPLGDITSINTKGYKEQAATGNVQHRQLGTYTDTKGNQHKINDVWFKHA